MDWIQITLAITPEDEPLYSTIFDQLGALSITLQDGADQALFEPAPGTTPLWQHTRITGLFSNAVNTDKLLQQIQQQSAKPLPSYQIETLADEEWTTTWLKDFKPMHFGNRLWICPSVYSPPDPSAVNIILDPGVAFGTGTHPTTALCLQWLDQHLQHNSSAIEMIDYGCGSGILAIAGIKLGVSRAFAIDIDPQALESTQNNAIKNGVTENIVTCLPEHYLPSHPVPLLLANILANPLVQLAETFANYVQTEGNIVLSGVLEDQAERIQDAYQPWFTIMHITQQDEWICLEGIRK